MYIPPYGPQPFQGPVPPSHGAPQMQRPPSFAGARRMPVGPPPHQRLWSSVPMRGQPPGQLPPSMPPQVPPPFVNRSTTFAGPLPSPRDHPRRYSIHGPTTYCPGLSRRSTCFDTRHNKINEEEQTRKARGGHSSSSGKEKRGKEQAEKFKEKRRRGRNINTQNSPQTKLEERPKDGPTMVNITILPEGKTGHLDELGKGRASFRKDSRKPRPRSRGRSLPDEKRPRRAITMTRSSSPLRNPFFPVALQMPTPQAPPTHPQSPRYENIRPRSLNVEHDVPVSSPHSPINPESSESIQKVINLLREINRKLPREDTTPAFHGGSVIRRRNLSREIRTTDDWDGESILDNVRTGKYVLAFIPAKFFSS
ncbi:hypothetical protein F5B22DRAFT_437716 [Xylaria bambusicola]|uniref:uncharacterized protein n=1 Tax=Xylaria bambusicola TaxID=326684 RepID=UPI002007A5E5|nr:uncharacterized protein F5B22DRAFT_437716 [Xylaria bambusicola]KAI0506796.1 hypothetical protein F5B22DRAFT_437716 [Xylaria bambusicola]